MTRLVIFTLAWCSGLLLAQAGMFSWTWLLLGIPPALVLFFGWWEHRWARQFAAIFLALFLGAGRFALAQPKIDDRHIAWYNDVTALTCEGVVIAAPEPRNYDTRLQVRITQISLVDGTVIAAHGKAQIYAPAYSEIRYGDLLRFAGTPTTPPVYASFNYRDYLMRHGVYSLVRDTEPEVLDTNQANPVMSGLLWMRDKAHLTLLAILPEPSASLLSGILLGIERGIPDALTEDFTTTGTSHIIAISGFNLTLIAAYVAKMAKRILKKDWQRLALSLGVLWLYVLFVGAAAAVVRAGVMATLVVIAQYSKRGIHGPTSLAAAVLTMSAVNPWVLWDAGFQLSFAATAGLIFYVDPWTAAFGKWLQKRMDSEKVDRWLGWISDNVIVTLAAQVTTLGVIVSTFRRVSVVSLLTNILILPVQNYIMILGAIALGAGSMGVVFGRIVALPVWALLSYTIACVEWTARFPGASVALEWATSSVVTLYYAALIAVTWWWRSDEDTRQRFTERLKQIKPAWWFVGAVAILALLMAAYFAPDGKLHVIALDVGNGDSTLIITPSGKQILIDGGPDGRQTLSQVSKYMPITDRTLDAVILTSPDRYRLPGLIDVVQRYNVQTIVTPAATLDGETGQEWQRLLGERDAGNNIHASSAFDWELGNGVILHALAYSAEPDAPLALLMEYGSTRVFLGGAVTVQGEAHLVEHYGESLRSNALFVPRNGRDTAASPALLGMVNPSVVVISASGENPPSDYVLARLSGFTLYRTDRNGTVEVLSDGQALYVKTSK